MNLVLKKIWNGWKRLAHKVARVQTTILLTSFYFLILAPLGALFKLFGWNPLETRGFHSPKSSNWKKIATAAPDLESLKRQS